MKHQLRDYMLHSDSRIQWLPLERLAAIWNLELMEVYFRHKRMAAGSVSHPAMPVADAAAFFIHLEEIGFDANPGPLVDLIAPSIRTKRLITAAEFVVLLYAKSPHRAKVQLQRSGGWPNDGDRSEVKRRDRDGRRVTCVSIGPVPYQLEITGRRYRATQPGRVGVCEYCGHEYMQDDPESPDAHRSTHALAKRLLDPEPLRHFADRLHNHPDPELVVQASPLWMHQAMYERAARFKSELGFDFPIWEGTAKTKNRDARSQGILMADRSGSAPGMIAGAMSFYQEQEGNWRLRWIWIAPKLRRAGILASRWGELRERYGDFKIDTPLSPAMSAFIDRFGSPSQKAQMLAEQAVA